MQDYESDGLNRTTGICNTWKMVLPNSESRISNQILAAKLCAVLTLNVW